MTHSLEPAHRRTHFLVKCCRATRQLLLIPSLYCVYIQALPSAGIGAIDAARLAASAASAAASWVPAIVANRTAEHDLPLVQATASFDGSHDLNADLPLPLDVPDMAGRINCNSSGYCRCSYWWRCCHTGLTMQCISAMTGAALESCTTICAGQPFGQVQVSKERRNESLMVCGAVWDRRSHSVATSGRWTACRRQWQPAAFDLQMTSSRMEAHPAGRSSS